MSIHANLCLINKNIQKALENRKPNVCGSGTTVKLVAVTKNQDVAAIRDVIDVGAEYIGENRVQEALSKAEQLSREVEWHLIGHLQTNKVRQAVGLFDIIHSVDSSRLAEEIDRQALRAGKVQDVLIQLNAAGEDTKFGVTPQEMPDLAKLIDGLNNVRLCGLMTIAPFFDNPEDGRPVFQNMYNLFMELKAMKLDNSSVEWLSMGMTNDYKVAIEEGANLVRIGTAIFGPRQY